MSSITQIELTQSRTNSPWRSRYQLHSDTDAEVKAETRGEVPKRAVVRQVGLHGACHDRVEHIGDQSVLAEDPKEGVCQPRRSHISKKSA